MAAMCAVYHGPEGLKAIAVRVHGLAGVFARGLKKLGTVSVQELPFFDTVKVNCTDAQAIAEAAYKYDMNLRVVDANTVNFTAESLAPEVQPAISSGLVRQSFYLTHPIFNSHHTEHELLRYLYKLQTRELSLCRSMIPLGSCTMKLNAIVEMIPITWPELANIHPFTPTEQAQGYQVMLPETIAIVMAPTDSTSFRSYGIFRLMDPIGMTEKLP